MKVTIVGCSGSFAGPDSPASCYLVEHDGFRIVLDIGSGAFGALQRHVALEDVDAILLSHLHPDHCADLTGVLVAKLFDPAGPFPTVPVCGPATTPQRIADLFGTTDLSMVARAFTHTDHVPAYDLGPFRVITTRVIHPVETYAIRLEAGDRTFVFSGDTGASESLVEISQGADLVMYEAAFTESRANPPGVHLTGKEAGEHATQAGVGRLILTHLATWNDDAVVEAEARSAFSGELTVARGGTSVEV